MIAGLILAAGKSSRMGRWKPAIKINGTPLILRAIGPMLDVVDKIVVVGGYRFLELKKLVINISPKIAVIKNENFATEEMFSSIRIGVKNLENFDIERFFILPGDFPFIKKSTYKKLLNINGQIVIPTYRHRAGHPVLLKGHFVNLLLNESPESNLREFLKRFKIEFVEVNDPGILFDIDTMEDFKRGKDFYTG